MLYSIKKNLIDKLNVIEYSKTISHIYFANVLLKEIKNNKSKLLEF